MSAIPIGHTVDQIAHLTAAPRIRRRVPGTTRWQTWYAGAWVDDAPPEPLPASSHSPVTRRYVEPEVAKPDPKPVKARPAYVTVKPQPFQPKPIPVVASVKEPKPPKEPKLPWRPRTVLPAPDLINETCKRGHTGEYVWDPRHRRMCMECRRKGQQERYARRKARTVTADWPAK